MGPLWPAWWLLERPRPREPSWAAGGAGRSPATAFNLDFSLLASGTRGRVGPDWRPECDDVPSRLRALAQMSHAAPAGLPRRQRRARACAPGVGVGVAGATRTFPTRVPLAFPAQAWPRWDLTAQASSGCSLGSPWKQWRACVLPAGGRCPRSWRFPQG